MCLKKLALFSFLFIVLLFLFAFFSSSSTKAYWSNDCVASHWDSCARTHQDCMWNSCAWQDWSGCCTWDEWGFCADNGGYCGACHGDNVCYTICDAGTVCDQYSYQCHAEGTTCGNWSSCSATCGGGTQTQDCNDTCNYWTNTQDCNTQSCCDANTITWDTWGACSTTCGTGTQTRTGTDNCGGTHTDTRSCTDASSCCTPENCGIVAGCDSYQNPRVCGEASGYQTCGTGICSDGTTIWTNYCNPNCSNANATCYKTPSCDTPVDCKTKPPDFCQGGGCPPTSCIGEGRCGTGGNCYTDCTACNTPKHLTCQNSVCQLVDGAGSNTCTSNGECQGTASSHLDCQSGACVYVAGGGSNNCASSVDCSAPPAPSLSLRSSCIYGNITDPTQAVNISWSNPPNPVTWVDISGSADFATFYHKQITGGATQTTAPDGFNGLTISPGVTYWVRLYNGVAANGGHSPSASFSIPLCTYPPPPTGLNANCPIPGTNATLSWNASSGATSYNLYIDGALFASNFNGTGYSVGSVPGSTHSWGVSACNSAGCSSIQNGLNYTCLFQDAEFISQVTPPATMFTGQTAQVSVVMRNRGNVAWTVAGGYKLGWTGVNEYGNPYWGVDRIPVSSDIGQYSQNSFNFPVTAPDTPGQYNFQWRMLQEGIAWFGDYSPNFVVNVDYPACPAGIGGCGDSVPNFYTISSCDGRWEHDPGPNYGYNKWCAYHVNSTRNNCYNCRSTTSAWIQSGGDVHANTSGGIKASGGP